MLKWDFTLFRVQGAWTLKVHGLEPQSQTCSPVVDAPTCGRLGLFFFFILIEIFSQLYTGCDFTVFISTDTFNGNSENMHKNNEYVLHPSSSTAVLSLWYVLGYFSEHVSFHLFSEVVPVIFFS